MKKAAAVLLAICFLLFSAQPALAEQDAPPPSLPEPKTDTSGLGEGVSVSGTVKTADGDVTVTGTSYPEQAKGMLDLMNKEREKAGLAALTLEQNLVQPALLRALELTVEFSHTRPNGAMCFSASGYMRAENMASGGDDYVSIMGSAGIDSSFMGSEEHSSIILSGKYTTAATVCLEWNGTLYWVQLFGNGKYIKR